MLLNLSLSSLSLYLSIYLSIYVANQPHTYPATLSTALSSLIRCYTLTSGLLVQSVVQLLQRAVDGGQLLHAVLHRSALALQGRQSAARQILVRALQLRVHRVERMEPVFQILDPVIQIPCDVIQLPGLVLHGPQAGVDHVQYRGHVVAGSGSGCNTASLA